MAVNKNGGKAPGNNEGDTQPPQDSSGEPASPGGNQKKDKAGEPVLVDGSWAKCEVDVFGPPPLPPGEDPKVYNAMLAALVGRAGAKDLIEEMLFRDVVYLQIEVQRLRRVKANLLSLARVDGLRKILEDINPLLNSVVKWAERWAAGEPQALAYIEDLLAKKGLTEEAIADEAFMFRIDDIERLDRMIAQAEVRRALALREIDRHRTVLAEQAEIAQEEFYRARIDYVPRKWRGR